MESKIQELKKDIAELEILYNQAQRRKVKDILTLEIRKLSDELSKIENEIRTSLKQSTPICTSRCYEVKITNYAWDQSDKFVKFYVTLPKVHTIPQENIYCNFNTKSLELHVMNLDNKNYLLAINNLLKPVVPESSNWKVKTDMVIVNVAKSDSSKWDFVTEMEQRSHESRKLPNLDTDENKDPSEMLMNLMKNTYEQGDDEMKRTIAKAWYESQKKGTPY
ncbi:calcyclin-binding protein [Agrilus planipennis]|uniref:Calcyclin-binding protein n=1 Tax=Agrilus planipennis TaxID=224129 RepID=A0A1W4WIL7_AGRPL|nr:calcyclin-binding protein [Agrilus planipennis]